MGCNIGASYDACTDPSDGQRYNYANCCRLRSGQDPSQRRMRGKNHDPANPPSGSQVCAMARRCLRSVRVSAVTSVDLLRPDTGFYFNPNRAIGGFV